MIRRIRLVVFLIASLVILTVVSGKMLLAERAVRLGEEFRFPVQGYDPHDPFRGRYLALSMENRARVRKGEPGAGVRRDRLRLDCPAAGRFGRVR